MLRGCVCRHRLGSTNASTSPGSAVRVSTVPVNGARIVRSRKFARAWSKFAKAATDPKPEDALKNIYA